MDFKIWNVKGYVGAELTKDNLYDEKYCFDEIKSNNPSIIKQIEDTINKGGIIFSLSKRKMIKAIYIFKLTKNDSEQNLYFDKKIILEEVNKCVKEFENDIDTALNWVLFERNDIDKAIWREKELSKKEKFKSAIAGIKTLTWIIMITCCIISLSIIVCGASYSLIISKSSISEIKNNDTIINYISILNNYSYSEINEIVSELVNKVWFVVVKILIPSIFTLFGYILLIISLMKVLNLTKNVVDNKSLFTMNKYKLFKKIVLITDIALFLILRDLVLWVGLEFLLEVISYMYKYCVQLTEGKKI